MTKQLMKAFAMLKIGAVGWIEKEIPALGPHFQDSITKGLSQKGSPFFHNLLYTNNW